MKADVFKQFIASRESKSFARLNPDLVAGRLPPANNKPQRRPTLERQQKGQDSRTGSPAYRVTLFYLGPRLPDSDNCVGSLKPLRDEIARWLGLDDKDANVDWQYPKPIQSIETGVLVKITKL